LPVLNAMKPWLTELRKATLPKSLLGKAVGYFLNQWDALCVFTGDGRVAIDNNRVERQMRCVAVGRKNWLFAGSEEGGHRAAAIYSLVCTCSLLGIEPWAYLKDVLQKLAEGADPAPSRRASGRRRAARPLRTDRRRRCNDPFAAASGRVGGPGAYSTGATLLPTSDALCAPGGSQSPAQAASGWGATSAPERRRGALAAPAQRGASASLRSGFRLTPKRFPHLGHRTVALQRRFDELPSLSL
jgi:hypothetical protein